MNTLSYQVEVVENGQKVLDRLRVTPFEYFLLLLMFTHHASVSFLWTCICQVRSS